MLKIVNFSVKLVAQPFGNLRYRDKTVLILIKDENGKYLLGAKKGHYPANIVRLIGGGVHNGESVMEAAQRELLEEMNVSITADNLIPLIQVNLSAEYASKTYITQVYIFFCSLVNIKYTAGDDVTEIVSYSKRDYQNLIKNYFLLRDDALFSEAGSSFSWGDYGRVYGYIHQIALEELQNLV